jgi:hypothetical protein
MLGAVVDGSGRGNHPRAHAARETCRRARTRFSARGRDLGSNANGSDSRALSPTSSRRGRSRAAVVHARTPLHDWRSPAGICLSSASLGTASLRRPFARPHCWTSARGIGARSSSSSETAYGKVRGLRDRDVSVVPRRPVRRPSVGRPALPSARAARIVDGRQRRAATGSAVDPAGRETPRGDEPSPAETVSCSMSGPPPPMDDAVR